MNEDDYKYKYREPDRGNTHPLTIGNTNICSDCDIVLGLSYVVLKDGRKLCRECHSERKNRMKIPRYD